MNRERKKDVFFAIYILVVVILAIIYFSVPERKEFLEFQFTWWGEMWHVLKGD